MTVPKLPIRPPGVAPLETKNGATQIAVTQGAGGVPTVFAQDRYGNVWRYETSTSKWVQLPPIPNPSHFASESKDAD